MPKGVISGDNLRRTGELIRQQRHSTRISIATLSFVLQNFTKLVWTNNVTNVYTNAAKFMGTQKPEVLPFWSGPGHFGDP